MLSNALLVSDRKHIFYDCLLLYILTDLFYFFLYNSVKSFLSFYFLIACWPNSVFRLGPCHLPSVRLRSHFGPLTNNKTSNNILIRFNGAVLETPRVRDYSSELY